MRPVSTLAIGRSATHTQLIVATRNAQVRVTEPAVGGGPDVGQGGPSVATGPLGFAPFSCV
jgi:hypothetical protein